MSKKGQLTKADYLPYDEFIDFLNELRKDKQYKWESFATIAFATALRGGDVVMLKWCDVLDKDKIVINEQKTKKSRKIPLFADTQKRIREIYSLSGESGIDEYICSNNFGGAVSIQHINRVLKVFRDKYNLSIDAFSTHTFRKSFGRYVYESKGRSAEALTLLNSIFNHTSIEVTKAYIGLRDDEKDKLFAMLFSKDLCYS